MIEPYYKNDDCSIYAGNCIDILKDMTEKSVNCCVTSPPYFGLRDYGKDGQVGLEKTPDEYVETMVNIFREVKRVLRDDGTLWLNLGDSYAGNCSRASNGGRAGLGTPRETVTKRIFEGIKAKNLLGMPWRVAFALQADGWYLRQDIIWEKPNALIESVKDRCTKAHEYIFLMSKKPKYYYDYEAVKQDAKTGQAKEGEDKPKKNRRSVWSVPVKPFKGAHFATFPPDLIEHCIIAGCPKDGVVIDPFMGSGTTLATSAIHGRKSKGIELNEEYCQLAIERIEKK